jgi:monoamine oxidase
LAKSEVEVAVVGAGAAGVAAGRHLHDAGIDCLMIEARPRLGGRAWTAEAAGFSIDLGCGWLHSADRNPWCAIAETQGRTIDRTPPPWMRSGMEIGFPLAEQRAFREALSAFHERMTAYGDDGPDVAAATLLEGGRWDGLINAVTTYLSGTEPANLSVRDFARYDDSGVNWRVSEGYGATIAAHAEGVPLKLGCAVTGIDRSEARVRVETAEGTVAADAVIVTLPSTVIAEERVRFTPALPEKVEAAAGLPLGLADKLFLALDDAEAFEADQRLFGSTDPSGTAAYHFRPFGRPMIEAYFGGSNAAELERGGERAFLDFATGELTSHLGSDFARRIRPLGMHRWGDDPFVRGSYSFALPGRADCRDVLAGPVDDRLFFAGEACSRNEYSTAHGAYLTGIAAAEQAIARIRRRK